MSDEFGKPASTTGIQWGDLKGALVLVKPHEFIPEMSTQFGDSSATRADVIVLDGDAEGVEYTDTLIFPKVLQSQVKGQIGSMVLGRVGQGEAKKGQSAPWKLAEATEADKTIAREYLAKNSSAPF